MEQFLLENADRHARLVKEFRPPKRQATGNVEQNPDIVIAARLRPMLQEEIAARLVPAAFHRGGVGGIVDLHELRRRPRGLPTLNSSNYLVDRVFGADDSTETVYSTLVQPLVPFAWQGGVSTLFAYGQTGSGKTFTVSGLECLVAESLFSGNLGGHRNVFISIAEMAGNSAFDLLNARKPISVLEDSFGTTHLAGAAEYKIEEASTLLKHIENAAAFRRTASTKKNDASSRSHAICRIRLENPALPESDDGLLYLIDLAGSEAARDLTVNSLDRMKEAREINTSLSVLKECIRGRASLQAEGGVTKKKPYIPFRQSALTKVLKHVFDPTTKRVCKTVVVACVNPNHLDTGPTKNTLRFAEMLRIPAPKPEEPKFDPVIPGTWSNRQLRQWITMNSGTPEIRPELLAPQETGKQLLRMPIPEFITRCLETTGVTVDQATAFQAKLWRLHVDSQRSGGKPAQATAKPATAPGGSDAESQAQRLSSRDPRPEMAKVPFKQRIRPGMVVSWNPPDDTPGYFRSQGRSLLMVLSPEARAQTEDDEEEEARYLAAVVAPAIMPGAFDIYLWYQLVVSIRNIEAEVLLEYDMATRYYYENL